MRQHYWWNYHFTFHPEILRNYPRLRNSPGMSVTLESANDFMLRMIISWPGDRMQVSKFGFSCSGTLITFIHFANKLVTVSTSSHFFRYAFSTIHCYRWRTVSHTGRLSFRARCHSYNESGQVVDSTISSLLEEARQIFRKAFEKCNFHLFCTWKCLRLVWIGLITNLDRTWLASEKISGLLKRLVPLFNRVVSH